MPGREMKGYAVMPDDVVADDARVDDWVGRALAYTATMPPKEPKAQQGEQGRLTLGAAYGLATAKRVAGLQACPA